MFGDFLAWLHWQGKKKLCGQDLDHKSAAVGQSSRQPHLSSAGQSVTAQAPPSLVVQTVDAGLEGRGGN